MIRKFTGLLVIDECNGITHADYRKGSGSILATFPCTKNCKMSAWETDKELGLSFEYARKEW